MPHTLHPLRPPALRSRKTCRPAMFRHIRNNELGQTQDCCSARDMQLQTGQPSPPPVLGARSSLGRPQFPRNRVVSSDSTTSRTIAEERQLLAAYEREQQRIAAPTTLREGFGSPTLDWAQSALEVAVTGYDANQIASVVQALTRQKRSFTVSRRARFAP